MKHSVFTSSKKRFFSQLNFMYVRLKWPCNLLSFDYIAKIVTFSDIANILVIL